MFGLLGRCLRFVVDLLVRLVCASVGWFSIGEAGGLFGCLRLVVCGMLFVVVLLFAFYFALIVVFGYIIRFIWAFLHRLVLLGCG